MHVLAQRRLRPSRPSPDADWRPVSPVAGLTWLDLADLDAPDGIRMVYAMLDAGLLEAWQDRHGHIRLRPPPTDPPRDPRNLGKPVT